MAGQLRSLLRALVNYSGLPPLAYFLNLLFVDLAVPGVCWVILVAVCALRLCFGSFVADFREVVFYAFYASWISVTVASAVVEPLASVALCNFSRVFVSFPSYLNRAYVFYVSNLFVVCLRSEGDIIAWAVWIFFSSCSHFLTFIGVFPCLAISLAMSFSSSGGSPLTTSFFSFSVLIAYEWESGFHLSKVVTRCVPK